MKHPAIIETERLILRPFTMDDIDPSYELNLDAEVSKYTNDGGVLSKKELARRITENVMGDYAKYGFGRMAVEVKNGPSFIGFCGLKFIPEDALTDLGYRFMKAHWGKGYATEAASACVNYGFQELGLKKISAFVMPDNNGSIHVLDKLGFEFHREILEDGVVVNHYKLESTDQ